MPLMQQTGHIMFSAISLFLCLAVFQKTKNRSIWVLHIGIVGYFNPATKWLQGKKCFGQISWRGECWKLWFPVWILVVPLLSKKTAWIPENSWMTFFLQQSQISLVCKFPWCFLRALILLARALKFYVLPLYYFILYFRSLSATTGFCSVTLRTLSCTTPCVETAPPLLTALCW